MYTKYDKYLRCYLNENGKEELSSCKKWSEWKKRIKQLKSRVDGKEELSGCKKQSG